MKNRTTFLIIFLLTFAFTALAIAQSVPPAAVTPAGAAILNGVAKATDVVPASVPAWLLGIISFLFTEAVGRGLPTAKPVSWFLFLEALVAALIVFLQKFQNMLNAVGSSFQNIKQTPSSP